MSDPSIVTKSAQIRSPSGARSAGRVEDFEVVAHRLAANKQDEEIAIETGFHRDSRYVRRVSQSQLPEESDRRRHGIFHARQPLEFHCHRLVLGVPWQR